MNFPITGDETFDFYRATIAKLPWDELPQAHLPQHEYPITEYVFKRNRVKWGRGTQWEGRVEWGEDGFGEYAEFAQPRTYVANDVTSAITAPVRHYVLSMTITEYERDQNKNREMVYNFLVQKKRSTLRRGFTQVENRMFKDPAGDSDTLLPYGIPYFIPAITLSQRTAHIAGGTSTVAFQGGVHPNFSAKMGLAPTASNFNGRLRSLNGAWSNNQGQIGEADYKLMERLLRFLKWDTPVSNDESLTVLRNLFIGAPLSLLETLSQQIKAVNTENNKKNVYGLTQSDFGAPIYFGVPVRRVEALETPTTAESVARGLFPMYFLNLDHIFPAVRENRFWFERPLAVDMVNNPEVFVQHWDMDYQIVTDNFQRMGGVLSYPTA